LQQQQDSFNENSISMLSTVDPVHIYI
jgi:hypothetical protein